MQKVIAGVSDEDGFDLLAVLEAEEELVVRPRPSRRDTAGVLILRESVIRAQLRRGRSFSAKSVTPRLCTIGRSAARGSAAPRSVEDLFELLQLQFGDVSTVSITWRQGRTSILPRWSSRALCRVRVTAEALRNVRKAERRGASSEERTSVPESVVKFCLSGEFRNSFKSNSLRRPHGARTQAPGGRAFKRRPHR